MKWRIMNSIRYLIKDMNVYIVLYFFIYFLTLCKTRKNQEKYLLILVVLIFLYVFRAPSVGLDYFGYVKNFMRMRDNPASWDYYIPCEFGFNYILYFIKKYISSQFFIAYGILGCIYIVGFYNMCRKSFCNIRVALLLFVLLGSYLLSFNLVRQCFALGVFMFAFSLMDMKKKSRRYILVLMILLITYFFHNSMIVLLVIFVYYTPCYDKLFSKRNIILLILLSVVCFKTKIVVAIGEQLVGNISYSSKGISYFLNSVTVEHEEYSFLKLLYISFFSIYVVCISKNTNNIFFFLYIIGIFFLNILGPLRVEFIRLYEIFSCLSIPYLAQLWNENPVNKLGTYYKPILLVYSSIIFFNVLIKNYGVITPYIFLWQC